MSCVVKWCKNRSDRTTKNRGITYHRFSIVNEVWRNDWIQIIRKCNNDNDWIPSKRSVICSCHFEDNDLYTTKGGRQRVVTYALPQKSTSMTVPELEHSSFITMNIKQKQENLPAEPNIICFSQGSTSMTVPALEHSSFSTMNIKQEQENLPAEPNIICFSQESTSVSVPALEHSGSSTMVLLAEPNISNALRENYPGIGECTITKKQNIIKKQARKIKTLKQKVNRLQSRNRSLKVIIKSLRNYVDPETFNRLKLKD
ncbi:THAP domain-containing protein 5-like isoform X2 [Ostrinia nubilalis]|uniref:THAP domain-containing protein 5-like isoform X2 n=1 Tax=Ostrinia nubilalis TaxID=29057 RepID=UPI00308247E7